MRSITFASGLIFLALATLTVADVDPQTRRTAADQPDTVAMLVAAGLDPDIMDENGRTPLMSAGYNGSIDVAIDTDDPVLVTHVASQKNGNLVTDLGYAVANGRWRSARALLESGVSVRMLVQKPDTAYVFVSRMPRDLAIAIIDRAVAEAPNDRLAIARKLLSHADGETDSMVLRRIVDIGFDQDDADQVFGTLVDDLERAGRWQDAEFLLGLGARRTIEKRAAAWAETRRALRDNDEKRLAQIFESPHHDDFLFDDIDWHIRYHEAASASERRAVTEAYQKMQRERKKLQDAAE